MPHCNHATSSRLTWYARPRAGCTRIRVRVGPQGQGKAAFAWRMASSSRQKSSFQLRSAGVWVPSVPSVAPAASSNPASGALLNIGTDVGLVVAALAARTQLMARRGRVQPQSPAVADVLSRRPSLPPVRLRHRRIVVLMCGLLLLALTWRVLKVEPTQFPSMLCPFFGYCELE